MLPRKFKYYVLLLSALMLHSSFIRKIDFYYTYGLKLAPSGSNCLVTYAQLTITDGQITVEKIINEEQFILQVSGTIHTIANPKPDDLFDKYKVPYCEPIIDTLSKKYKGLDCPLLKNLWKLRYKRDIRNKNYNFQNRSAVEGWAGTDFWPSAAQSEFLKKQYKSDLINNYVYGETMFKLLKDVQDTVWQNDYKALR